MIAGIMQPYTFPYMGYYQLVSSVNKFVFLDDVNYIKRGWINRNNILVNGEENMFTIPIENASQNRHINEHYVSHTYEQWKKSFYKTLEFSYQKHKNYDEIIELIRSTLDEKKTISNLAIDSIKNVCAYLEISTEFSLSSELNLSSTGETRIIEICKNLGVTVYHNPFGGQSLYHRSHFKDHSIDLYFLQTNYSSRLSIIDVLMNHGKMSKQYLQEYNLI